MIRVAFRYKDPRAFARLICLLQGGDASHSEIAYRWEGSYHDCISSSWLDNGVRLKQINLTPDKWRVYEVDLASEGDVAGYYEKYKGTKYDWLALLGFVITRRIKGFVKRKFCSEVGADILGLSEGWRYDLNLLESVCARVGRRIQ